MKVVTSGGRRVERYRCVGCVEAATCFTLLPDPTDAIVARIVPAETGGAR